MTITLWFQQHNILLLLGLIISLAGLLIFRFRRRSLYWWGTWGGLVIAVAITLFMLRTAPMSINEHSPAVIEPMEQNLTSVSEIEAVTTAGEKPTLSVTKDKTWDKDSGAVGLVSPLPSLHASAATNSTARNVVLPTGLTRLKENVGVIKPEDVIAVADWLYFRHGTALWQSDGTVAGTVVAVAGIEPVGMTACNGHLYFRHSDQLWRLQPNAESPQLVKEGMRGPWPAAVQCSGDKLFFAQHRQELWQIDGRDSRATLVKDMNPGDYGHKIEKLVSFQDQVFFTAYTDQMGDALWVSDGTLAGTLPLTTLPMAITGFASVQETLFFMLGCCQLWRVTADLTGAELVKDFATEGASSVNLFPARTRLYVTAVQPIPDEVAFVQSTLWRSHGSAAETQKLYAYVRHNLTYATQVIGDRLLFEEVRYDGALFGERQLLLSDGTITATTTLPFDLDYTQFYADIALPPFPDQLFAVYDRTLWRTDGTVTNTVALTSTRSGPHTLYPWEVTQFGDRFVYTQPDDHLSGIPLWISDGTPTGSQLLVDFAPTPMDYGAIRQITNVNGKLFFFVYDPFGDSGGLWVYRSELTAER